MVITDPWTEKVNEVLWTALEEKGYVKTPAGDQTSLSDVPAEVLIGALKAAAEETASFASHAVGAEEIDVPLSLFWVWHFVHWHVRRKDPHKNACNYVALAECGDTVSDEVVSALGSLPTITDYKTLLVDFVENDQHWMHGPNLNWMVVPQETRLAHLPQELACRYVDAKRELQLKAAGIEE